MIPIIFSIYFINLFFALNLVFKTQYKLSYINYTLLFLIAFPIFTPIVYFLIFLDETIMSRSSIEYSEYKIKGEQTIFNNGETFYDDLIQEISNAKHFIIINMFIFNTDQIGRKIISLLEDKQREGVQVIVLFDAFAKKKQKQKYFKHLKNNGGQVIAFLPLFLNKFFNLNYRNHRKIIVIDHTIGYIGGFNIGDEYLSRDPKLGIWTDIELKIKGDVSQLTQLINEDLKLVNKNIHHLLKQVPDSKVVLKKQEIRLIPSGLERDRINQTLFNFLDLIYHAKQSIYIMTPYLVITDGLIDALVYAATKGVDIKIIIPSKNDHPFVNNASRAMALKLLHKNIQVSLYSKDAFMHAKVQLIDGKEALITSANLDNRSCKYNLECGAHITNKETVDIMMKQFEEKLNYSKPFTKHDCRRIDQLALFLSAIL
jgi:cardiolipin synthase A/B